MSTNANVIEIGCGPGYTTYAVLEAMSKVKITAVDNEPSMMQQARRNLDEYVEKGQVRLIEQDAVEYLMETPSQSIDGIISAFTLHNFRNDYRQQIMKEIQRVLPPGGVFVNADKYAQHDPIQHAEALNRQLTQFNNIYRQIGRLDLAESWIEHYLEDELRERIMYEQEAHIDLRNQGFQSTTTYRNGMEAIIVAVKS